MRAPRQRVLAALLAATAALPAAVWAQSATELDALEAALARQEETLRKLQALVESRPGSVEALRKRYADAEIQFVLGDYATASVLLAGVVADPRFEADRRYPDALYYLAESLFQTRNLAGAQVYLRKLAARPSEHRQAAVSRYVEIAARRNALSEVESLLTLVRRKDGQLPAEVAYASGKALWARGELPAEERCNKMREVLLPLVEDPAGEQAFQAGYLLGACAYASGQAQKALEGFEDLRRREPMLPRDVEIRTLAVLAAARLLHDEGRHKEAIARYAEVPQGSEHHPQALYEQAWAQVRRGTFEGAQRTLARLLTLAADSPLAPEAALLRGHLLLKVGKGEEAKAAYRRAVATYAPLRDQIDRVLADLSDPGAFVEKLWRANRKLDLSSALPKVAARWSAQSPKAEQAARLLTGLAASRTAVEDGQRTAQRLLAALERGGDKLFPALAEGRVQATELGAGAAAALEGLARLAPGPSAAEDTRRRHAAASARAARVRTSSEGLGRQLDQELTRARTGLKESVRSQLAGLEAQAREVQALWETARPVVGQLVVEAVRETRARFHQLVLKADLGIADVAFTRKQVRSQQIQRLAAEREQALRLLDARFAKVHEEPAGEGRRPGDAPAAPAPPPVSLASHARSDDEKRAFEELTHAFSSYRAEVSAFVADASRLARRKEQGARDALEQRYEREVRALEGLERQERLATVAAFEDFLQRHPDDPGLTPDVLFRLAELHYERAADEHLLKLRAHEDRLRALQPNAKEVPPEPQVDFARAIALYRELVSRFPDAPSSDGAQYLLAYCLEKQGQHAESRAAYQTLIERHPRSRFATEAWVRLGEEAFEDDPDRAAQAYERAVLDRTHPLYDKALYKLGWTYYRLGRNQEAVARFLQLADHYDGASRAPGNEPGGGDLREEALQYTAVALSDAPGGALQKARELLGGVGQRPYVADIYRRLGNSFTDQGRHAEAVSAYRLALEAAPLGPEAPQTVQRVVFALQRQGRVDEAHAESEGLAKLVQPGSAWHQRHRADAPRIEKAQQLAEEAVAAAGLYQHQQAQAQQKQGRREEALAAYAAAKKSYGAYLSTFPDSKRAYEIEYYLAECFFALEEWGEAARRYDGVRDSKRDNRFVVEASYAAVLAWQRFLDSEVSAGKVSAARPVLSSARGDAAPKVTPLHEVEHKLVTASDAFARTHAKDGRAASVAYKAAELFWVHDDFPEARRRFEELIVRHPKTEEARWAANLIVESFLIGKDWKAVEEVAERLLSNREVLSPGSELSATLQKLKLAARFKLATLLLEQKQYEPAAKRFLALVEEAPKHEFADEALNNAAVAYESALRFDSAFRLYERIVRDYPTSATADQALFRLAVNAENAYEFDRAVEGYQRLVRDYPASKSREAALFNAARLLEGLQRYKEAAAAFVRYAELFPKNPDAGKLHFRAALLYEKQNDARGELAALEAFVRRFGASGGEQAERVIEARRRMGDAWARLARPAESKAAYEQAVVEYELRRFKPDAHPLATEAAAVSAFALAEGHFREFDKLKLSGRGKALAKTLEAKKAALKRVQDAYGEVFAYKRVEWTLAALFRKSYALERFAATLVETPVPPEVVRAGEAAVVEYQSQVSEQTVMLEEKAVESYVAALAEAKKHRISNAWTRRTLESLSRFRPKEYPVLKETRNAFAAGALYPEGWVTQPPPATRLEETAEVKK